MHRLTDEQMARIEQSFRDRLLAQMGIGSGDAKRINGSKAMGKQVEFFAGAMAAIQTLTMPADAKELNAPPKWVISLMSGRSII